MENDFFMIIDRAVMHFTINSCKVKRFMAIHHMKKQNNQKKLPLGGSLIT